MRVHTAPVWFQDLVTTSIEEAGSQKELAQRVGGVTQQTISNWKNGRSPMPGEAARFANAIGVDAFDLVSRLWPELRDTDRLAGIRDALAGATDQQVADVEAYARVLTDSPAEPAPRRSRRAAGGSGQGRA